MVSYTVDEFQDRLDEADYDWNQDEKTYKIEIGSEGQYNEIKLQLKDWRQEYMTFEVISNRVIKEDESGTNESNAIESFLENT